MPANTDGTHDALVQRESRFLCSTYGRYPLAVARAAGSRLYDLQGREYTDMLSGIAVCSLGHSHPEVVETIRTQAEKLIHVSNLFYTEEQVELAERLAATCGAERIFFANSGAEANEAAIKLARRYMREVAGRDAYEVITLTGSFHGRTLATIAATGQPKVKEGFAPLPEGFVTVPFGDMQALTDAITERTAAVLVEVIQGEGGVRALGAENLRAIRALCDERDVLLIIDEIQTGCCRTGAFWGFQHHDVQPDIFTSAKGLGSGVPIGAMLATGRVAEGFCFGSHGTTFGGNPLCAAVAAKVVEVMQRDQLAERAAELGAYATGRFHEIAAAVPGAVTEVRGQGLMLGIRLHTNIDAQATWANLLEAGFVCNLTQGDVLRLLPPLTIERADLDAFADALTHILQKANA